MLPFDGSLSSCLLRCPLSLWSVVSSREEGSQGLNTGEGPVRERTVREHTLRIQRTSRCPFDEARLECIHDVIACDFMWRFSTDNCRVIHVFGDNANSSRNIWPAGFTTDLSPASIDLCTRGRAVRTVKKLNPKWYFKRRGKNTIPDNLCGRWRVCVVFLPASSLFPQFLVAQPALPSFLFSPSSRPTRSFFPYFSPLPLRKISLMYLALLRV